MALLLMCHAVQPCGPFFPNSILATGRRAFLMAPEAEFSTELEKQKLFPPRPPIVHPERTHEQETIETDVSDISKILTEPAAVKRYREIREQISNNTGPVTATDFEELTQLGVPVEFTLYLQGANHWRLGEKEAAAKCWRELLDLPREQRLQRSTWAAYMLAKAQIDGEAAVAHEAFGLVRRLAGAGFADTLNMADGSDGWDARVYLREGQYAQAIQLYLKRHDSISARIAAARAIDNLDGPELQALAANDTLRKVITSFLISGGIRRESDLPQNDLKSARLPKWLVAIEAAGIRNEPLAERLALAAYQHGDMEEAQRWISASPKSPNSQWLQAKLRLYEGKIDEAARVLRQLSKNSSSANDDEEPAKMIGGLHLNLSFRFDGDSPQSDKSARRGIFDELAAVELNRQHFVEALDAFMKAEAWEDAAFVAERVLQVDELKKFVDSNHRLNNGEAGSEYSGRLRELLARRLMRLNKIMEARPYFSAGNRAHYDALVKHLSEGADAKAAGPERAKSLFEAAHLTRHHGLELLGTELEPDWAIHGGNYEMSLTAESRRATEADSLPPSEKELLRLKASELPLPKRFHYRFVAAELAWQAAALMPNNTDETARVLCEAGSWIKVLDPPRADRFYKSLVRRCRRTELGATADKLRWFPTLDDNGRVQK